MGLFARTKKSAPEQLLGKMLAGTEPPTFPQPTLRILQKVRDPQVELDQIVESLQWDPTLVVRVLRTVNTAAYGPANPIENVHHAVSYMGRAQLEQIVLALAVRKALPSRPAVGFDVRRYWVGASRRAALARHISKRLHPVNSSECFTAGLLQDMGIPVLAHARPAEYGPVLTEWHAGGSSLEELERSVFGWTHAEAGGLLSRTWELPAALAESIFHHHREGATDAQLLPALRMVSVLGETESNHGAEAFVEIGTADYGLESDWLLQILSDAEEQAQELAVLIS